MNSENRIPYAFYSIPHELFEDEFIEDALMLKIIREIFRRIRKYPHVEKILNNRKWQDVHLGPDQFIYGREAWALKFKTSEKKIRLRLEKLIQYNYLQRIDENIEDPRASSRASSPSEKKASSRASTYSILRFCVEAFYNKIENVENQEKGQQLGQQSRQEKGHKDRISKNNKEYLLLFSEKNYNKEFTENWTEKAEQEIAGSKFKNTPIDDFVRKYQIPEKNIRDWLDREYSCEYILDKLQILQEQYPNKFVTDSRELRFVKDLTEKVMLEETTKENDNVCYVVHSEILRLLNDAITKNYAKNSKKTKEKNNPGHFPKRKNKTFDPVELSKESLKQQPSVIEPQWMKDIVLPESERGFFKAKEIVSK